MLTKRDLENVIEADRDAAPVDWCYWRDSGSFHVWRADGFGWLLQVSHVENHLAVNDVEDDGYRMVTASYSDDRLGLAFVRFCIRNPAAAFEHLAEQDAATVVEAEVEIKE